MSSVILVRVLVSVKLACVGFLKLMCTSSMVQLGMAVHAADWAAIPQLARQAERKRVLRVV